MSFLHAIYAYTTFSPLTIILGSIAQSENTSLSTEIARYRQRSVDRDRPRGRSSILPKVVVLPLVGGYTFCLVLLQGSLVSTMEVLDATLSSVPCSLSTEPVGRSGIWATAHPGPRERLTYDIFTKRRR